MESSESKIWSFIFWHKTPCEVHHRHLKAWFWFFHWQIWHWILRKGRRGRLLNFHTSIVLANTIKARLIAWNIFKIFKNNPTVVQAFANASNTNFYSTSRLGLGLITEKISKKSKKLLKHQFRPYDNLLTKIKRYAAYEGGEGVNVNLKNIQLLKFLCILPISTQNLTLSFFNKNLKLNCSTS